MLEMILKDHRVDSILKLKNITFLTIQKKKSLNFI